MERHEWGAALRGVLGAFLGAFLAAVLWYHSLWTAPDWPGGLGKLLYLLGFTVGPAACLGYWLCRGLRAGRFAHRATRLCAVLALPPALPAALWLAVLPRFGSAAPAWEAVRQSLAPKDYGAVLVLSALVPAVSGGLFQKRLLKYTDPAWARDPRRAAAEYAGGLLYNFRPEAMPLPEGPLPRRFSVGSALEVDGEQIRTTSSVRREGRFPVRDVAGVVLGPGSGSNVLYDRQGRTLAKFAWSMENSDVFAAYLTERGVKMISIQEYRPPA